MENVKLVENKKNFYHKIMENESLETIAKTYGISVEKIKDLNLNCEFSAGNYIFVNTEKVNYYVVKPVDTLNSIANKLGVSVTLLKTKNNINNVFIGQIIKY